MSGQHAAGIRSFDPSVEEGASLLHGEAVGRRDELHGPAHARTDTNLPVIAAEFGRAGDPRSTAVETVIAGADLIRLTWFDCIDPFVLHAPPGFNQRPIGVFSTFFPARSAQVEWNGRFATGQPWAEVRGDRQASSACLAWSETWVKPRG